MEQRVESPCNGAAPGGVDELLAAARDAIDGGATADPRCQESVQEDPEVSCG